MLSSSYCQWKRYIYQALGIGYTRYGFGYTVSSFRMQTFIYIYIYIFFYFFIFYFFMNLGIYLFYYFFLFFIFIFNFFLEFRHLNLAAQCLLPLWNLPCITPLKYHTLNFVRTGEDLTIFSTMNLEFMTHTSHLDISPIWVQ